MMLETIVSHGFGRGFGRRFGGRWLGRVGYRFALWSLCVSFVAGGWAVPDVYGKEKRVIGDVEQMLGAIDRLQVIMPELIDIDERLFLDDQKSKLVRALHAENLLALGGVSMGNPEGRFTIVEFSDYNCGYCRIAHPVLLRLVEEDKDIHLVYRDLPIVGGDVSWEATRVALAADKQGLAAALTNTLYEHQGRVDKDVAIATAQALGADIERLGEDANASDVNASLAVTYALRQRLRIASTPTFIFGDTVVRGAIQYEDAKQLVNQLRNEQ
ncbi:MAG: DsbA family protein [Alphaproteobacteria bacterium GM7ARS4]|nr:DsbA family protein [Alphaproteobacteria bacterium GM7ARS4]